jgi:hypothetical protein
MRRVWLGAGLALCTVAMTASSLTRVLPPPVVSLSTLTPRVAVVARDSVDVVIAWTKRCDAGGCPTRYRVALAGEYVPTTARVRTGGRDTLRVAKPTCPSRMTVRAAVIADRGTESSAAGASALAIRCRAPNADELAFNDTFPQTGSRLTFGDWATRRRAGDPYRVDSLRTTGRSPQSLVEFGYTVPTCWLLKNRYTGAVILLRSDPLACEPVRARYQSERSS